jgi:hypothetical protein
MKFPGKIIFVASVGGSILAGAGFSTHAADDPLAWPPITAQTKPWAWWWWHGSAVDETNLAHELQRFHDAGLGGVQITTIYGVKGAEARDIPYLTPHWLDMMGYTVDAAKSLDMGVTMSLGSGWCFGGPTVSDQDANASVVVKTYAVVAGQKVDGKFNRESTQALVAFSPEGKAVELTDKISPNGELDWIAPNDSTNWTVYAISQKPSGQKVKRPGPGGEGWMLNPAYPQAVTNWLKWFDAALANYHGSRPLAVFQDSYEYRTDWAPDFFVQFEKRRGYKLQDELPTLFSGTGILPASSTGGARGATRPTEDEISRVKYDYRRTISEIMAQQSEPAWIDWAHKNGFSTIYQAHGTPANWLDLYGDADMPETEMFHNDRSILISKFASSAAHTQGRQFTGAETGTWLEEHFTETLGDLKALADDMFLSGVNRIFYHGACYSPDDAPWPGWLFYASTEMNPRNPIWRDVPALNAYIARCQAVLQAGQPDNDVLLYWPVADFWSQPEGMLQPMAVGKTDWFENQPIGKTAHELWNKGYQFDYVSDAQLLKAKVVDGKIQMPGGKFKVIVVPECKYMPLGTYEELMELVQGGAKLVMNKPPQDISGFNVLEKQRAEFKTLLAKAPRGGRLHHFTSEARFGNGVIYSFDASPADAGVAPDIMQRYGISSVRRSFDGGWNYFIVNRSDKPFSMGWIPLAVAAKSVVILDPMTGKTGTARIEQRDDKNTWVNYPLEPGESVILRAYADQKIEGEAWDYIRMVGGIIVAGTATGISTTYEISGRWDVSFLQGGPALPATFQTDKLGSWTACNDTNAQNFAGTAKYQITFASPLPMRPSWKYFELSLGDVRQSARVRVNGKDYGTLITPPFRVVVDNLKPTGNVLEVEVTSVAANRIRDLDRRGVNWKYFKDINVVNENYKPFNAADWPLTDCGLLGPVTLTPVTAK